MMTAKERIPLSGLSVHMVFEKNSVRGFIGFFSQWHICFFGSAVAFLGIAPLAGCSQIGPRISASSCTWRYVIYSKVFARTAILALVVVAFKDILAGKVNTFIRGIDIPAKTDHGWHWETLCDSMKLVSI